MDIKTIMEFMTEARGTDLFLKPGSPPAVKIDGALKFLGDEPITEEFNRAIFEHNATKHAKDRLEREQETDVAMEFEGIGRFRANVFFQRGKLSIVMRRILTHIGSFEDLNLPMKGLMKLATAHRGLVLVTGVAGSGKSTTLSAMIEYINQNQCRHIITIEDPIEFIYQDKRSMIQQRELGLDTESYASALKHVVRQSPDVILIGEMRDRETMEAALNAAETGHLVFSTLHTVNATQTVERIIGFFPPHQHDLIRLQMSLLLQGVVSMRLVPKQDGKGRVPAVEILVTSPTVREMLEEGKTTDLPKALVEGEYYGMQTFNQSLIAYVRSGTISIDQAMAMSDDPDALKLELRGIRKGV